MSFLRYSVFRGCSGTGIRNERLFDENLAETGQISGKQSFSSGSSEAIKDHNLEAAPGRLGQGSKETYEYILKYKGKLNKNEDYENIAIKANSDGSFLRLKMWQE
jgi:hypothetical protein